MEESNKINKIVSLSKRRGFVFQSSEIYGGLKSCYDYGPLGTELKRNIASQWWKSMVYERDDIYGLDASIIMHPKVWQVSGHLDNFSDPLVDCFNCKERFRPDKVKPLEKGIQVEYTINGSKQKKTAPVSEYGYVCPFCNCPELSPPRQFRCMFQSNLGPIDPVQEFVESHYDKKMEKSEFISKLNEKIASSAVYLRPETAQAMFVQFNNVLQTTSAKVPFGIAQMGKSFRNEIIVEHFIFRSCEFEQMEMEFFCEPGTQSHWLNYWKEERLQWYRKYANNPDDFRLRQHDKDELAHYSDSCFDVEYKYPWGWDELEGIASRTDYDLNKHAQASGVKLSYFDPHKDDPKKGTKGWRYTPYVVEPAAGLTRTMLALMLDAYCEDVQTDAKGNRKTRVYLKLHPALSPYKLAVLPLLRKDGHPEKAKEIKSYFSKKGLRTSFDEVSSIGKRYAKHDEIGTPWCLTIDSQSLEDDTFTLRNRDTTEQVRLKLEEIESILTKSMNS